MPTTTRNHRSREANQIQEQAVSKATMVAAKGGEASGENEKEQIDGIVSFLLRLMTVFLKSGVYPSHGIQCQEVNEAAEAMSLKIVDKKQRRGTTRKIVTPSTIAEQAVNQALNGSPHYTAIFKEHCLLFEGRKDKHRLLFTVDNYIGHLRGLGEQCLREDLNKKMHELLLEFNTLIGKEEHAFEFPHMTNVVSLCLIPIFCLNEKKIDATECKDILQRIANKYADSLISCMEKVEASKHMNFWDHELVPFVIEPLPDIPSTKGGEFSMERLMDEAKKKSCSLKAVVKEKKKEVVERPEFIGYRLRSSRLRD